MHEHFQLDVNDSALEAEGRGQVAVSLHPILRDLTQFLAGDENHR
jgi:hypothetical protein